MTVRKLSLEPRKQATVDNGYRFEERPEVEAQPAPEQTQRSYRFDGPARQAPKAVRAPQPISEQVIKYNPAEPNRSALPLTPDDVSAPAGLSIDGVAPAVRNASRANFARLNAARADTKPWSQTQPAAQVPVWPENK